MTALIDIRTVFVLMSFIAFVSGLAMFFLWRLNPAERSALYWAAAAMLVTIGQLLIGLRGVLPDYASIVLANSCIAIGHGFHLVGVDVLLDRKPRRWVPLAAGGAILASFPWLTYVWPDTGVRIAIQFTLLGLLGMVTAHSLIVADSPRTRAARLAAGWVFAALGVALLARVAAIALDRPGQDLFVTSTIHAAIFTFIMIGYAVLMFTLSLLLYAKEQAKIADLALFPAQNPSPVMRFRADGLFLQANAASAQLLAAWGVAGEGARLPGDWRARLEGVFQHGEPVVEELRIGSRTLSLTIVPIVEQGYLNLYATDVSARKAAEEAIRTANQSLELRVRERTLELEARIQEHLRTQKDLAEAKEQAEHASRAKSEFLSRMSHELRTPLNSILGFAELLATDTHAPLSAQQSESIGNVLESGRHLLALINDVLDIAQVESGRFSPEFEELDPCAIVAECMVLVRTAAGQRGVAVYNECLPGTLVRADKLRLKQVLLNLLANAVKYNRPNGEVRITMARAPGARLRISVADTGPGIPAHRHGELFEPFNRLGAERTAVEGTGVGLAVAKYLVEAMHGSIGVSSEVGRGATFWIELALAQGE